MFFDVSLFVCLVVRTFLEILEMWDSHFCAWTWRAIAIFCVGRASCLKVIASRGSFWKDTSWAISGSVLTLNVLVLLMTIGITFTFAFSVPCVRRACLSGS